MTEQETPLSILNDYLERTGNQFRQDALAATQINILKRCVTHLGEVLAAENIPWPVSERIIREVIYGCVPSQIDIDERKRMYAETYSIMRRSSIPHPFLED